METYLIPEFNLDQLRQNLGKLTKRAVKLGVAAIQINEGQPFDVPRVKHGDGSQYWFSAQGPVPADKKILSYTRFFPVSVEGKSPVLNGWTLAGTIQPIQTEDGMESIFRIAGDIEITQETREFLRSRAMYCDHCHTERRRNDVYVVQNAANAEFKVVGSSCIRDFLGHESPETFLNMAALLASIHDLCAGAEDEDYFGGSGRGMTRFDVETVLEMGACVIRKDGFTSAKAAREDEFKTATGAQVFGILLTRPSDTDYREIKRDYLDAVTDDDRQLAANARDWARTLVDSDSEYLYTLSVMARAIALTGREMGYAVSMIQAYRKEMLLIEERKAEAQISNHFGEIGERMPMTLTFLGSSTFPGQYGVTTICRFKTPEGNRVTWFASGERQFDQGEVWSAVATIKGHDEYKGVKITTISRAADYVEKVKKSRAKKPQAV